MAITLPMVWERASTIPSYQQLHTLFLALFLYVPIALNNPNETVRD